jgi:hypothetical protein
MPSDSAPPAEPPHDYADLSAAERDLVAAGSGWRFEDQPSTRVVASLAMSTEDAWRLLTSNLPAGRRTELAASGDSLVTGILLHTRTIIGVSEGA